MRLPVMETASCFWHAALLINTASSKIWKKSQKYSLKNSHAAAIRLAFISSPTNIKFRLWTKRQCCWYQIYSRRKSSILFVTLETQNIRRHRLNAKISKMFMHNIQCFQDVILDPQGLSFLQSRVLFSQRPSWYVLRGEYPSWEARAHVAPKPG